MSFSVYVYVNANVDSLNNLKNIMVSYNNSDDIPDEIVFNVTGIESEEHLSILKDLYREKYSNVHIYATKSHSSKAKEYNKAVVLTTGDFVVFNPPNRIPSSKRMEITKHFTSLGKYGILHNCCYSVDALNDGYEIENIKTISSDMLFARYYPFKEQYGCWRYTRTYGSEFGLKSVDMESPVVYRDILKVTKWKEPFECKLYHGNSDGMSYEFALETLYTYKKSLIIDLPLTIYGVL